VVGVLQLINAKDGNGTIVSFQKADEPLIMLFASHAAIAIERALLTKAIILRMIGMAQMRDPYETGAHALRVASYAVEIYERWAQRHMISLEEMNKKKDLLKIGAMLHDVGKVAVSDTILKKPARLSPEEFCAMKQHACLGARLFSERQSDFDEACLIVALNHHERWDGKGYPGHIDYMTGKPLKGNANAGEAQGKKAEEIPVFGRIVAIADVYDALCSPRAYKEPYGETKALEILSEEAGKHFDPDMTEDFFAAGPVIREIAERYSEGIDTLML
jgi:HD-GYP domain-containing protein (c-di-GMP phosphodiesterase class II)